VKQCLSVQGVRVRRGGWSRDKYTDLNPSNFSEFIICELHVPLIGSCFSCRSNPPP
jgi:hypothetical protein